MGSTSSVEVCPLLSAVLIMYFFGKFLDTLLSDKHLLKCQCICWPEILLHHLVCAWYLSVMQFSKLSVSRLGYF